MKRLCVCLTAAALCGGCQYDPFVARLTAQRPRAEDAVGRNKLTEQTVTDGGLPALNGKASAVILLAGGKSTASNVPAAPYETGLPDAGFFRTLVSGSGTWRIDEAGGGPGGSGQKLIFWGVSFQSPAADIKEATFTGDKPPYGLLFTIGDPDGGHATICERQP